MPDPLANIQFRTQVVASDSEDVARLVKATGFFSPMEVEVAVELVQERRLKGEASGYHFLMAQHGQSGQGPLLGYGCFGPIPCTLSSFDLYWIVVHPEAQGQGLGKRLLTMCEEEIIQLGGIRAYAETSSRPQYHPTRCFYERCGYALEATLADFYAPGDHKVVYCKVL
jgi:ribosomal protein S18 acetylase RimI-like enzyme